MMSLVFQCETLSRLRNSLPTVFPANFHSSHTSQVREQAAARAFSVRNTSGGAETVESKRGKSFLSQREAAQTFNA